MGKFLHNGKAVHLRHNDVENHHIRLLIFDYVTDFFSVVCFSDQFKVFIFFDHLTELSVIFALSSAIATFNLSIEDL